jgi:very-short-patch-repair endonuclease
MPTFRKRPRKALPRPQAESEEQTRANLPPPLAESGGRTCDDLPPPLAGGGEETNAERSSLRGWGKLDAKQLRAQSSDAERKLWYFLRRKHMGGLRFRRQFPLGPYFADFVCLPARLVVEVDGGQHSEDAQAAHDRRRTAWLNKNGFRVIRFWAGDVMRDPHNVLEGIELALSRGAIASTQ